MKNRRAIVFDDEPPVLDLLNTFLSHRGYEVRCFSSATDGVVEAENDNSELLGNDRLVGYIGNAEGPPWGMGVLDLRRRWRGNSSAHDDLTILEIRRDQ